MPSRRPAAELEQPPAVVALGAGDLAGLVQQRPAGGVLLPAAALAAAAAPPVAHHLHVADLAADAVPAAVQRAVEHDAAADAGADRDEDEVLLAAAGAEAVLAPGGGVRVVLHDTGSPTRSATSSRSGSSRHDRLGANSTVERSAVTKPAAPMPTASTCVALAPARRRRRR